jgi:hypothetical protein
LTQLERGVKGVMKKTRVAPCFSTSGRSGVEFFCMDYSHSSLIKYYFGFTLHLKTRSLNS